MTTSSDDSNQNSDREAVQNECMVFIELLLKEYLLLGADVGLQFVSEIEMTDLNKKFRFLSKPTDVLAFPRREWVPPLATGPHPDSDDLNTAPHNSWLGDIVICPSYAEKEAKQRDQSLNSEIKMLIVHGFLHLCGHDHQTEVDHLKMFTEQRRLLDLFVDETFSNSSCDYLEIPNEEHLEADGSSYFG